MNTLINSLIEKGLNPRFLFCKVVTPRLIQQKLEEFLPYCDITLSKIENNYLLFVIDFFDFKYQIKFNYTKDKIIENIVELREKEE